MIVEKKEIYLNFMCFKLPRKLGVQSLQRQTLPCSPDFLVCAVWIETTLECYWYSLEQRLTHDLRFHWELPQVLD